MKRSDSASPLRPGRALGLTLLVLAPLAGFSACGGGGGTVGQAGTGNNATGDFAVLRTKPVNGETIFLNDPINIDFTTPVDIDTATLSSMTFQALDQQGSPVSELVVGEFNVTTSPGDDTPGRRLQFVPRFPTNNAYTNGGFKAGRQYLVQLVGGSNNSNNDTS